MTAKINLWYQSQGDVKKLLLNVFIFCLECVLMKGRCAYLLFLVPLSEAGSQAWKTPEADELALDPCSNKTVSRWAQVSFHVCEELCRCGGTFQYSNVLGFERK